MSFSKLLRRLLPPVLGVIAVAWVAVSLEAKRSHLADVDCASCHLGGNRTTGERTSTLIASEEALCGRCHQNELKVAHPSGFPAKRELPGEYPVDWKGDLTCSSCHNVHGNAQGLLRGTKRGREFCQSCHSEAFFKTMRDHGSSMMASGHFSAGIRTGNADLDPYSLQCLGCHSGSANPNGVAVDHNAVMRHSSGAANHPIGKRYSVAARYGGYRAENIVTRKLLLPGGRISCVSCHQGYAKEHGKLVVANSRSALCYECHDI